MTRKLTFSVLSLVAALGIVWATTPANAAGTADPAKPAVTQSATDQKAPAAVKGKEQGTAAKPAAGKQAPATQENKPSGPQSLNGGLVNEIQVAGLASGQDSKSVVESRIPTTGKGITVAEAKSAAPAPAAPAAATPAAETKAPVAPAPAGETKAAAPATTPAAQTPAAPVETKAPVAKEGK